MELMIDLAGTPRASGPRTAGGGEVVPAVRRCGRRYRGARPPPPYAPPALTGGSSVRLEYGTGAGGAEREIALATCRAELATPDMWMGR